MPRLRLDDGLLVMDALAPILRWPGGKRNVAEQIASGLGRGRKLIEPFLGGASVFCEVSRRGLFDQAILSDANDEVMNLYRVVRDNPAEFITRFDAWPQSEEWYYYVRDQSIIHGYDDAIDLAVRTQYLNRLCFNGLYRQNQRGVFNASWGKFKRRRPVDVDNIHRMSAALQGVELITADFRDVIARAGEGDIVYADPPYPSEEKRRGFSTYMGGGFSWTDHVDLAQMLSDAADRGARCGVSNNWMNEVIELYESHGFDVGVVEMRRAINTNGEGRGTVPEMLAWKGEVRA